METSSTLIPLPLQQTYFWYNKQCMDSSRAARSDRKYQLSLGKPPVYSIDIYTEFTTYKAAVYTHKRWLSKFTDKTHNNYTEKTLSLFLNKKTKGEKKVLSKAKNKLDFKPRCATMSGVVAIYQTVVFDNWNHCHKKHSDSYTISSALCRSSIFNIHHNPMRCIVA